MKNIILITFLFFFYSCGYTTVYKNIGNQDFQVIITDMQGDRQMNNLIKNQINLYSNKDSLNKIDVEVETEYQKIILTKDSTGIITDYELSVITTFIIHFNENSKKTTFDETINIKKRSDTFEQDAYENNIKINFASSIREKLISEIMTLQYGDRIITKK
tara:strand:+ start:388 stop:867 length:480 start_codon:yes stop_codon:yes gene_type:complete